MELILSRARLGVCDVVVVRQLKKRILEEKTNEN
jgi:hypothetical protein